MKTERSIRLAVVVALAILIFGTALPARAVTTGAFSFVMTMVWPDFPCGGAVCGVTSLSGPFVPAIVGTGPNGVTACAPFLSPCTLSEGPAGIIYDEPPCVAGEPLQGSASGQAQVNGGTSVLAAKTPFVLTVAWIRLGVHVLITFSGGQIGIAEGLFRVVTGDDCISGNGPARVQIIGTGWIGDF